VPLIDHFHPPLHGPRRWEGFHHAWATFIAQQLNQETLPPGYFAQSEICVGPELQVDVATLELPSERASQPLVAACWSPPKPRIAVKTHFAQLDTWEVRVYQDLDDAELRAAIELISPANKDRAGSRKTFAAKCAGYLRHGIGVVIIDVVTSRSANLHKEIFDILEIDQRRSAWKSKTRLYAVSYRAVTVRRSPRVEVWPESISLGKGLPDMPLWLSVDCCVRLRL
jgi:hypothetical protein